MNHLVNVPSQGPLSQKYTLAIGRRNTTVAQSCFSCGGRGQQVTDCHHKSEAWLLRLSLATSLGSKEVRLC